MRFSILGRGSALGFWGFGFERLWFLGGPVSLILLKKLLGILVYGGAEASGNSRMLALQGT